jgi:hypothetical protein
MARKFGRQLRETVCNANRIKALDRNRNSLEQESRLSGVRGN